MESLDPVALYFKEIRKTPPLNHKKFLSYFHVFIKGERASARLEKLKGRVSKKLKLKLLTAVKEGTNAKVTLVIGNLRLVIPVAKHFFRPGLDFLDLIEEGNIGLLHALKKFDPRKGFRFSTYASYWIDQAVRRFIEESFTTIRIPPHAWEALRKWFREWEALSSALGRNPTLSEMAQRLNLSARQIKGVVEAVEASRGIGSIDMTLDEDENLTLKDIVTDKETREPDKLFSALRLQDEVGLALNKLPAREKDILTLRFGIGGGKSSTLEEVGTKYKISRERVRQIQERASTRLKKIAQKMGLN